jgi:hypothetical protein
MSMIFFTIFGKKSKEKSRNDANSLKNIGTTHCRFLNISAIMYKPFIDKAV